jgi:thymidylate synthase
MARIDYTYHTLLEKILEEGYDYKDESRNVMCKQVSSYEFRHNLQTDGFPAITTKKLYWKGIVGELIWFLKGNTNIKYLVDNNIHIWDKDAYNWYLKTSDNPVYNIEEFIEYIKNNNVKHLDKIKFGNLGSVYGAQWKSWSAPILYNNITWLPIKLDQISSLIQNLKDKPMSRRHIVTAWNPAELDEMALPPCHWAFEIIPRPLNYIKRYQINNSSKSGIHNSGNWGKEADTDIKYTFDLKWHQRSVDTFLGLPFNIASYGLLANVIGKLTNMVPSELIGDLSNVHIYDSHIEAIKEQLNKDVNKHNKCKLEFHPEFDIATNAVNMKILTLDEYFKELRIDMFKLKDYESYPAIKAEMLAPM